MREWGHGQATSSMSMDADSAAWDQARVSAPIGSPMGTLTDEEEPEAPTTPKSGGSGLPCAKPLRRAGTYDMFIFYFFKRRFRIIVILVHALFENSSHISYCSVHGNLCFFSRYCFLFKWALFQGGGILEDAFI